MNGQGIAQFIPLILIFVIFYFFLIRPQQKKVKEHKIMVENLKRGDKVITSGGIIGTVERIIEDVIATENVFFSKLDQETFNFINSLKLLLGKKIRIKANYNE